MFSEQSQQHHAMELVGKDESGAEEWYCPTCGRRFLMQWPPEYKKVILEVGDEMAIHSGGKGGITIQPPQVSLESGDMDQDTFDNDLDWSEDPYLIPWEAWLQEAGFEEWWSREN